MPHTEALRWIAALLASTSLIALVTHLAGLLPMVYFLTAFGVPSVVLLFVIAALARRLNAAVLLACLRAGLVGGFLATLAYDVLRWLLQLTALPGYDGFVSIYIFGGWITGRPTTSLAAGVAGWAYHFWNGLSFGVLYTLTFGQGPWWWGVAYGMVMEALMLGLFPLMPIVTTRLDFILGSMAGHVAYGAVLGVVCQRAALNWSDVPTLADAPVGR